MDRYTEWKPTAPFRFGVEDPLPAQLPPETNPRLTRNQAIMVLLQRGFIYVGEDSLGLPCFRSRSGAMLIAVGSCRCLAYAKVGDRLQVVATARTLSLLCRICPEVPTGAAPAAAPALDPGDLATTHQPESALVI